MNKFCSDTVVGSHISLLESHKKAIGLNLCPKPLFQSTKVTNQLVDNDYSLVILALEMCKILPTTKPSMYTKYRRSGNFHVKNNSRKKFSC